MASFIDKTKILCDALKGDSTIPKTELAEFLCDRVESRANYERAGYRVNVVGARGSGKSSLINNIIGQEILPRGVASMISVEVTCVKSAVPEFHLVATNYFGKTRHAVFTHLDDLHAILKRLYSDITAAKISILVPSVELAATTFVEVPQSQDHIINYHGTSSCAVDYEYDADFVLLCVTPEYPKIPPTTTMKMDGLYKRWAVVVNGPSEDTVATISRTLTSKGIDPHTTEFFQVDANQPETYKTVVDSTTKRIVASRTTFHQEFLDTTYVMMEFACDPEFAIFTPKLESAIVHAKHHLHTAFAKFTVPNIDKLYDAVRACKRSELVALWDRVFNKEMWSHIFKTRETVLQILYNTFSEDALILSFVHSFLMYDFDAHLRRAERDFRSVLCRVWRSEGSNREHVVTLIQCEVSQLLQRVSESASAVLDNFVQLAKCATQDSIYDALYVRNAFVTVFEDVRVCDDGTSVYGWGNVVVRPPGTFSRFSHV